MSTLNSITLSILLWGVSLSVSGALLFGGMVLLINDPSPHTFVSAVAAIIVVAFLIELTLRVWTTYTSIGGRLT